MHNYVTRSDNKGNTVKAGPSELLTPTESAIKIKEHYFDSSFKLHNAKVKLWPLNEHFSDQAIFPKSLSVAQAIFNNC